LAGARAAGRRLGLSGAVTLAVLLASPALAADLDGCRKLLLAGQYAEVITAAEKAVADQDSDEEWALLLTDALMTVGRYADALQAANAGLRRFPYSIRLRLAAHDVFRYNAQAERSTEMLQAINLYASTRDWAYRDPANRVALGRAALLLGVDPRRVLEAFFEPARRTDPKFREAHLAIGRLALAKSDFELASRTFAEALKLFPEDPDLHFGLAEAFAPSDPVQMFESLEAALEFNTNHVGAWLRAADHHIDAEEYAEAEETLATVLRINPAHPEAWAMRAVLAHLRADAMAEHTHRAHALAWWKDNPQVDHLIGRKLSQKYRFAEGAEYQRRALKFDPDFLPAKIQLAQDLLRLGEEEQGWKLAEAVHEADAYDVVAYNLITLKDHMAESVTLTNEHFLLRMDPREAAIYGPQALALLERARAHLCAKYGLEPEQPTTVEIFPQQKDFAIRTFGLPGGAGYLGVCFGNLITANSPASQTASPANWQAVLWHEFCHVVTLQLTRNKMPRWLSEGISVYEERQAHPTWGEQLDHTYRAMILGKDLVPVSELSGAFLSPKSPQHLQFAYYHSSLVVEFLIDRFGLENLKKTLADLARGRPINDAIAAHTAPMDQVEKEFAALARQRAQALAPGLDWEKPSPAALALPGGLAGWAERHPNNFYALNRKAKELLEEEKWEEAKTPLQKLIELYPTQTGADSAYAMLARAHRELDETKSERDVLTKLAEFSADAVDAYLRLMELCAEAGDWEAVALNAERHLAVNPLMPQPHRYRARAQAELGHAQPAIESYRTLLRLDPPDPAEVHFQLARLLQGEKDPAARRHVLQALEEAPRFREAQRLLLEIRRQPTPDKPLKERPAEAPRLINL
jgi:tetratricopeptide (TPR) repeat protein